MLKPIVITCGERTADFSMDLDPGFVADNAISWYLQQGYPCEPEVVHFMAHVVQPGDFVVDAGANVGFSRCCWRDTSALTDRLWRLNQARTICINCIATFC